MLIVNTADKILKRNIGTYYLCVILTTISRTLPHAVLTVLLLNKGIKISEIGQIQALYNIAMVFSEFPSGVISDILSRKKVYTLSIVVLIISYFLVVFSAHYTLIALAWFLYGVSSALDTGTLDTEIINGIKKQKDDHYLSAFMGRVQQTALVSSIAGSGIGFALYNIIGCNIYFISIALLLFSIFIVSFWFKTESKTTMETTFTVDGIKSHIKEAFQEIREFPVLLMLIILSSIMQVFFQTHYHFWQAICLERGISKNYFYILYVVFQLISIFAYKLKIAQFRIKHIIINVVLSIISVTAMFISKNNILFLILYSFLCFEMTVFMFLSSFYFGKYVSMKHISALTSLTSTINRLVSFVVLISISQLLAFTNLLYIFFANTVLTLAIISSIYLTGYIIIHED